MSAVQHGYIAYTCGCRCEVCRAAKAAYMRAKRARAREYAASGADRGPNFVPGVKHGISGYQNHYCRCEVCVAASRTNGNRQYRARRRRTPRPTAAAGDARAALEGVALPRPGGD